MPQMCAVMGHSSLSCHPSCHIYSWKATDHPIIWSAPFATVRSCILSGRGASDTALRLAGISALDLWIVRLNHRQEPLAGQKGRLWEFCGKHHATTWVIVSKTSK